MINLTQMRDELSRTLRRARNIVRIGKTTLAANETTTVQTLQVKINEWEAMDNVQSVNNYGFTSSPPVGTDAIVLCVGGDNWNGVAIGTNHNQFRPTGMATGESMQYDNSGQSVHLKSDGSVVVTGKTSITFQVGSTTVATLTETGLMVNGSINTTGNATVNGISVDGHVHTGVQAGGATTGPPVG